MLSSVSMQDYQSLNHYYSSKKAPVSSKLLNYNNLYFQTIDSFYHKKNHHKNDSSTKLTALNLDSKNIVKNLFQAPCVNKNIYNVPIIANDGKIYEQRKEKYINNVTQAYTSENDNILNLPFSQMNLNGKKEFSPNDINQNKIQNGIIFFTPKIKNKHQKTPTTLFLRNFPVQNQIILNQNNINYQNSKYLTDVKIKLNSSTDDLTNILNTSTDELLPEYNYVPNHVDENEPKNDFKLTDYSIIKEIGKGAEGKIYMIRWHKNNKDYALKKTQIFSPLNINKKKNDNAALKNFIESTGCDGIIKPYATLMKPNDIAFTDCYEIMELAEKDWETEIANRNKEKRFYPEFELMEIFRNLIKTFSLLQKNHITHRDIKPQNILFVNGKMKICDFGNARVLKRNGFIIQRIRGSELFMSPIVFKGYRSGMQKIKHNAYKSDVYSLGVCFLFAASLSADGPNYMRMMEDNNQIKKVLDYNLKAKYSANLINLIMIMLQVDENNRPDFIELERMIS